MTILNIYLFIYFNSRRLFSDCIVLCLSHRATSLSLTPPHPVVTYVFKWQMNKFDMIKPALSTAIYYFRWFGRPTLSICFSFTWKFRAQFGRAKGIHSAIYIVLTLSSTINCLSLGDRVLTHERRRSNLKMRFQLKILGKQLLSFASMQSIVRLVILVLGRQCAVRRFSPIKVIYKAMWFRFVWRSSSVSAFTSISVLSSLWSVCVWYVRPLMVLRFCYLNCEIKII